jgi:DNA-binding GntR family transcriptional regulator
MFNKDIHLPKYRTMTEIAVQRIKHSILKGDYPPGTRLIPVKLEKELGLGRVSIREALRELSGSGFVLSIPNKGSIVADAPKVEEIKEIFEIRYLLEGKAAQLATRQISDEDLAVLADLQKVMTRASTSPEDYFFLNRDFHLMIYEASGWSYLCRVISQLINQVQAFRLRYPYRLSDLRAYNKDHEKIMKAIRDRKAENVKKYMLENVHRGFDTLMAVYARKEKVK